MAENKVKCVLSLLDHKSNIFCESYADSLSNCPVQSSGVGGSDSLSNNSSDSDII